MFNVQDRQEDWIPLEAANRAARGKHEVYSKWDIPKQDVIPLAFDTYGGYAKDTWKFLHTIVHSLVGGNKAKAEKCMRNLREKIAMHAREQSGIISEFNYRNDLAKGIFRSRFR